MTTSVSESDFALIATASVDEAIKLRDRIKEDLGIDLLLERNPECKGGGCAVKIDVYVDRENESSLKAYFEKKQNEALADPAAYDPSKEHARCPACGTEFSTRLTECPDCGLGFGAG